MEEQTQIIGEWEKVYGALEKEVNNRLVMKWLKRSIPEKTDSNRVCLAFPSPCIEEVIKRNYAPQILNIWQRENPAVTALDFKVLSPQNKNNNASLPTADSAESQPIIDSGESQPIVVDKIKRYGTSKVEIDVTSETETIPCYLDESHTFERFVVGKSNVFAYEAARRVAEDEKDVFNPLYIHSPVGLGKTHLLHAVAWRVKELYPDKNVLYISSEQFFQYFLKALRNKKTDSFRDLFRAVDILMIDDIQFICGKKATQEEFFHTFNQLIACGKKVILSSDSHPMDLIEMQERLKTRIAQGLVVHIEPTTYELRLGILREKGKHLPVQISDEVLDFLAKNITGSIRELEGALKRLTAHAQIMGTPINPQTTRSVLKDMLQVYDRQFSVNEIQRVTADYYHLKLSDIQSARRDRKIARPRQMAMYLAKTATALSLPDIGRRFGRDHTTVMHAVKTIENLMSRDKQLCQDKENILMRLREGV